MRYAFCHGSALVTRRLRASIHSGRGFLTIRNSRPRPGIAANSRPTSTWQATLSTKEHTHHPTKTAYNNNVTDPNNTNTERNTTIPSPQGIVVPLDSSTSMRTHGCGELRAEHAGEHVRVAGWAHAVRDRGGVLFILVRDRHGIVQVTVGDACVPAVVSAAKDVRLEYCLAVSGTVALRDPAVVNEKMPTGAIEILVDELTVVNETKPMPFMIDAAKTNNDTPADGSEETRLRYRYLDLRRPALQRNLVSRHRATFAARSYLDSSGFVEVETPILTKATPEGARDYLVPSRVHRAKWYALPQSPQIYKQLLMVGGMDRYFQITKCFRDEDLRMDRQPEFTQVDMEMAFVSRDDVMKAAEGVVKAMFERVCPDVRIDNIPRISYDEAMERFGVDAPDMRFAMELQNLTKLPQVATSEFAPIAKALESPGGIVKAIVYKGAAKKCSRKVIDGYTEFAKQYGVSGVLFGKMGADGAISGPLAKIHPQDPAAIPRHLGAEEGDLILCCAGEAKVVNAGLGRLRVKLGHESGLISDGPRYKFVWVVDFPLFEYDAELGRYTSVHHPFTAPNHEDMHKLLEEDADLGDIKSDAYDLVCNGSELGGGSIRISDMKLQKRVFECLGITHEEQRAKFGFLLDALAYGAPVHGGLALGLDRCIMHMTGAEGIRDVIAFPKTTSAADIMAGAPSQVPTALLDELHVASTEDRNGGEEE